MILVIAVLSIVVAMSAPFYSRFLLQNAVANTTDQLAGSLRKAQTYAMAGKQGSVWSVNYSSNSITLYIGSTFAGHNTAFDETFSVNPNVSITGITDISFVRITGIPNITPTITISSGANSKTITVNAQGMVTK